MARVKKSRSKDCKAQAPGQGHSAPARAPLPPTPLAWLSSVGWDRGHHTASFPRTQWKNPKSLNNRTDASTSAVTAPLLHDSESKGRRKPVSNLDGSDPRAIYVTAVPETSPRFLSGATSPRSAEKFPLGPLPLAILASKCKTPPQSRSCSAAGPWGTPGSGAELKNTCIIFLTVTECVLLISNQSKVNC